MDFLPVWSNGERVYAEFWKRLWAGLIDLIITVPIWYIPSRFQSANKAIAIPTVVASYLLFWLYNVYFNARFGGTLGKLAVGIRITKPNGHPVYWAEAFKRSSVDFLFTLVYLYVFVGALLPVNQELYSSLEFFERHDLLKSHRPSWFNLVDILQQVWFWSELVILLFNKRRRAAHDFIAGTVVIRKKFAEQGVPPDRR